MDETQMILALRALRELLDNGDRDKNKPMTGKDRTRVARYLREAAKQQAGTCHDLPYARLGRRQLLPQRGDLGCRRRVAVDHNNVR